MNKKIEFILSISGAARAASIQSGLSYELMLAQAAQETGWGQRVLPGTNNIFNIKADSRWTGQNKEFQVTECVAGRHVKVTDKFRVYSSIEEAFTDRVKFLEQNPRYSELFSAEVKGNLSAEAKVLQAAGYATDPLYARKLQSVFDGRTMQNALAIAEELAFSQQTRRFDPPPPTRDTTVQFAPYAVIGYGSNATPTLFANNQGTELTTNYPGGIRLEAAYSAGGQDKGITVNLPNSAQSAVLSQDQIER